ncbi:SLC13 family permease [Brevibacterium antiquum]|uniref:Transporter, UIT1 family (TC 9.B.48) n=2 Tax=Brevibacterium antiquum TaxID=234835 RepID=A0A2H1JQ11_9MICO|nr:SLC13 family permease [Brevibacterium antiquum]SMX89586.1 transporter, UIT1 family (TC 9.B.48) [Brevibacterium antiquum CNRZ 918]SMX99627.1 transporter, UIT1 family (TC 9.B.48) [Brevibacterium antiquum]
MTCGFICAIVVGLMFVIGTWRDINMGLLGFVAAAGVGGLVLHHAPEEFLAGFPVDLFLTLVGLTYLFGFAQNNGVIEVIVSWCVNLVGGRTALMPWIFFTLTAILISLGALFAVAIIAPLALSFARKHRINQFMVGLLVVHGALAGAFSPISVYGIFINDYLAKNGLTPTPVSLFLAPLIFNVVFALVVYFVLHRRPGLRAEADDALSRGIESSETGSSVAATNITRTSITRLTRSQVPTLIGLIAMALSVLIFGWDVGIVTITIAVALTFISPAAGKAAMTKVSWSVVILITGVLTYISVLQAAGTVEWVSAGISAIGVPLLAALLLFYMSGLISALASSLAIIGVVIALAVPFLESGDVHVGGFVAALAIAATIVDISPFSTNGAMLLANVHSTIRDRYYKQMIGYAGLMCLIGPGLAWVVAAVPSVLTV